MSPIKVAPRPPRRLADLSSTAVALPAAPLGFLDASAEDRLRWTAGFRALLDGLQAPLQVLVDFSPGRGQPAKAEGPAELPPPWAWRRLDLDFAAALETSPSAQTRSVHLITAPSGLEAVRRSLAAMGVGAGEPLHWQPAPELAFGLETPTAVRDGEGWHRTWFVDRFPGGELEPGWLLRLVPAEVRVRLSWHAERLPTAWVVDYLQRQLVNMRAARIQREAADPELGAAEPTAELLQQQLISSRESAFFVSLYLTVSADTEAELGEASSRLESAARASLCRLVACTFRQLDGRLATLPLGRDPLGRRRLLHTSALLTLFPWFDADLRQPRGLVLGRSLATGLPVMVDLFDESRYPNANVAVFGHSGAGKTYLLSTLTMGCLAAGCQVFVIDPEHEYGRLAHLLGGLDVRLSIGSGHSLNVLDLRSRDEGETSFGSAVADSLDLCEAICGRLDEVERATLEVAVRQTFETVAEPVLGDVVGRLDPGSRVGRILARWVQGGLGQLFSRPTNLDLDAQLVVFGMRELRPEMVAPVHYLLAEALWARIKRRERRRLLVVDELGLLFEDPTIRRFVVGLARRIRKYDGSLVFATQNPGDLLGSEAGQVVATNPGVHFFGAMRPGEAAKVQEVFGLSASQRAALETARRGEFLLSAGADRLRVRIQAPPWQARAMKEARAPPRSGCSLARKVGCSRAPCDPPSTAPRPGSGS